MSGLDFSKLSDDELFALAEHGGAPKQKVQSSEPDFANMSDDELFEMASHGGVKKLPPAKTSKGIGDMALEGGLWALDKLDSVTGAPTRAAIGAIQDDKNPVSAFANQFGKDTSLAPTGKTIMQKAGVSDDALSDTFPSLYNEDGEGLQLQKGGWADFTKSGVAGFGVDILADPTNLIGLGAVKGAGNAAAKATKAAAVGSKNAALATAEAVGKGIAKGAAKGVDAISGTKAGSEALEGFSKFVTPRVADDYGKFLDIAKAHNIDPKVLPSSVEFGPDNFISRADRNIAEGPIGQARLEKFRQAEDAVQEALENQVTKISGGARLDEVAAGQHLRDSFDRGVDKFFEGVDWTHNMVQQQAPGLMLSEGGAKTLSSKVNGIEKYAKGLVERGITNTERTQGDQLLRAVEAIRNSKGSYKQINEAREMIGRAAFKAKNALADIPPDVEKLRDLYFAIDDALIDTTKSNLGDDIAQRLSDNNKAMSEFFGQKGVLSPVVGARGMSNEQVFKSLVLNGDSRKIEALKKVLPPEDFKALQGAFLESLIRRNPDGTVSLGRLHGTMQAKKNQLRALFPNVGDIEGITQLAELSGRMGNPVLSSSGTGASNVFRDLTKGVSDSIGSSVIVDKMKDAARNKAPLSLVDRAAPIADDITEFIPDAPKKSFTQKAMSLAPIASDSKEVVAGRVGHVGAKLSSTDRANKSPEEKLIEKIDRNPELLQTIRNPNLRRQLEIQVKQRREEREMQTFEEQMQNSREAQDSFLEGN